MIKKNVGHKKISIDIFFPTIFWTKKNLIRKIYFTKIHLPKKYYVLVIIWMLKSASKGLTLVRNLITGPSRDWGEVSGKLQPKAKIGHFPPLTRFW